MEDWKYKMAKKRVDKVKAFYKHFSTWLVFAAFFILLNIITDRSSFWAIFPIAGWGLGVALHAIGVFSLPGQRKDWEERMIEEEMQRLEEEEYRMQGRRRAGSLPPAKEGSEEELELREMRKEWRDTDLV